MTKFEELGVGKPILDALAKMGFEDAFPIQTAAIPVLMAGRDVVGQAHTGSGKTAAFGVPMLQSITPGAGVQGLVLAPTRELANQITDEMRKFGQFTRLKIITVYGGQNMGGQVSELRSNPEIVVATPGRLIDHINRGTITLDKASHVVLDEADTMLDMGFIDDIRFILSVTPAEKVMSLFSATMPVDILRLAEEYLRDAKQFLLDADDLSGEGIDQSYLVIRDREKPDHLFNFLKQNKDGQCIVFCSTKYRTRDVAYMLRKAFDTAVIEGDMSQPQREASMSRFRRGKARVLVATDVAARGIDIPQVSLVINYDVPTQDMTYFHRIGRTARAGAKGRAITFVSYSSIPDFNIIKRQIKVDLRDLNEEMGIKVSIPDPLKRQVGRRGRGPSRDFRGGRGGGRYRGRQGGGRRDERDFGRGQRRGGFSRDRPGRGSDPGRGPRRDHGRSDFKRDRPGGDFKRDRPGGDFKRDRPGRSRDFGREPQREKGDGFGKKPGLRSRW